MSHCPSLSSWTLSRLLTCDLASADTDGHMSTNNKRGQPPPTRAPRSDASSGNKQVVYTLFASAAAAIATWYYSFIHTPTSFAVLPASYALCAEPGKIYTSDPLKPSVDCFVVDKQTILTTGTQRRSFAAT